MKCPKCKHENRDGAVFCEKCGTKLQLICPNCGNELRPEAIFCDKCGTKITDTASPTQSNIPIPTLEKIHSESKNWIPDALAQKYLSAEQQYTRRE